MTNPFRALLDALFDLESGGSRARREYALMPIGEAVDMGHAPDGTPSIDSRIFDGGEFARNPYPYYRNVRDHHPVFHDRLHGCCFVWRYADITACYFDEIGDNTIPKGSSSEVRGNTQLELRGIEHVRRRNVDGRHLVGAVLTKPPGSPAAIHLVVRRDDAAEGPTIRSLRLGDLHSVRHLPASLS